MYHFPEPVTYIYMSIQASNAIGVLCQSEESKDVAKEMFAQILSALMLRIGVSVMIDSSKKPLCVRCV